MNKFLSLIAVAFLCFLLSGLSGCMLFQEKLPPGQEKKIDDEQSAKDYAPGQEKKD
jgi:hypothetical protein